jgi:Na+-driven multidrug efflux pump
VVGIIWLATYFIAPGSFLKFETANWKPRLDLWRKMLGIGLPAGAEFGITALYLVIVYSVTRQFGAAAQAGFGIGMRIIQSGFMPVVALGFSVAPVAGQNFGARQAQRVRSTFKDAALMAIGAMVVFAVISYAFAAELIGIFTNDPAVVAVGEEYLRIVAWTFVPSGVIFVASSMFQAMGNTLPSLVTSAARILLVAIPVFALSRMAGFQLHWIWYLSLGSVLVQLALSMLLLRREFGRRLRFETLAP